MAYPYPDLSPTPIGIATINRLYSALPEAYRYADEDQGWPLYLWLAGTVAELGEVDVLLDRVDYVTVDDGGTLGDTSDLTDPVAADLEWLPWLAQLVGVPLRPDLTDAEKRDAIRYASAGWRAGTKTAVAAAAKTELTGTQYARVYDHSITEPGDGGQWDVLIITRVTETPDVDRVLLAVDRRAAKPAGVVLHHRAYEAGWDTVVSTYSTWNALEAAGDWDRIQEAGL